MNRFSIARMSSVARLARSRADLAIKPLCEPRDYGQIAPHSRRPCTDLKSDLSLVLSGVLSRRQQAGSVWRRPPADTRDAATLQCPADCP
ncbi:MAG: hypothetical protein U0Z53_30425 [Blastocatellia bacterium]